MTTEETSSAGVQQLIERLHGEGLAKGQAEAEQLIADARAKAVEIIDDAKREADEIATSAIHEAERTRVAGEEAVRIAGRDTILRLTDELAEDFVRKLRHLVGHTLQDTEFLRSMILQITSGAVSGEPGGAQNVVVMVDPTENSELPADQESLDAFIRSLIGETLQDGLTFEIEESEVPGVRVQAVDGDLEIDLTAETLTALLVKHLSPRFRAIVEHA